MKMQGNTILVAGAARGIGRGLAGLLHRLGNEVLVFDADAQAARALAQAHPGMRSVALDLADPWSVAGFCEQVAALCPALNLLVDIDIAFPVTQLPGLRALLDDDPTPLQREAHRLGMQHLTGALLPHLRKRPHSAVMTLTVGPARATPAHGPAALGAWAASTGGLAMSTLAVRKRWASARIEVIDVARPSRAERLGVEGASRAQLLVDVAHLLAEGLHEQDALARLRALWPARRPQPHRTQDDDLLSAVA